MAEDDLRSLVQAEVKAYLDAQKAASPAKEEKAKDGNVFKVFWKNGLNLETADKSVKMKLGGRIHIDAAFYSDDDYVEATGSNLRDGIEFRRARLITSGQIGKHIAFKLAVDFGAEPPDTFAFRDMYIDFINLRDCWGCGVPDVAVGQFKTPFSLEFITSSNYITFIERSLANALSPAFAIGAAAHDSLAGGQLNYAIGVFSENTGDGEDSVWSPGSANDDIDQTGYSIAARVTWTPWFDCDCPCNRWHIGASAWLREDLSEVRIRQRPESHVTSHRPVDTGAFLADSAQHFGFETGLTYGPWSLQAEYIMASFDSPDAGDPEFTGWYAFVSYWLTGECRPYKEGMYDRVLPCCNWLDDDCCCKGGWEVAVRASSLDLTDGLQPGGEMMSYTLGVNWHINPNTRIMFNLIYSDVDSRRDNEPVDESFLTFALRFQVDW